MTQIASGGGGGRLPPPPRPKAASTSTGANPRGVAIAAPRPVYRPPARSAGAPPSHTDASGGYDTHRASAYKATPHYAAAVKQVFNAQPLKQKAAIVRGAAKNAQADPYTAKAVREALYSLPIYEKTTLAKYLPHNAGISVGGLFGKLGHIFSPETVYGSSGKTGQGGLIGSATPFGAGTYGRQIAKIPYLIGKATLEEPAVIPKTITGLGETAVGSLAALAELPVKAVQEGPGKAISQTASGIARDYSQRYGPLLAGNDQAFVNRIKQQGAGAEALDALGLAGAADATLGRGASAIARKTEAATGKANFLTRERPALRVSGGEVRPQNVAKTAGRVTAQRVEDRLRRLRGAGQTPLAANEVAPLFKGRATRVLVSHVAQKTRRSMQESLNREVRHGAEADARKLNTWERKAMPVALEGIIPLRSGREAALNAIENRKRMIEADRAGSKLSPGNRIPAQIADKVDELKLLNDMQANVGKWLTPRFADFVDKQGIRAGRIERNLPSSYLRTDTAEARRLRPQGEVLGIKHPDEAVKELEPKMQEIASRPEGSKALLTFGADLKRTRKINTAGSEAERLANHGEMRPGLLADYSKQVRAAARERGLPEPSYIRHQPHPKTDFGAYTQGMGHKAMPGPKQSEFALFRGGAVHRSSQTYFDSLARSIKAGHQWRLTTEQFRRNALPTPTKDAIRSALGHNKHPADLTGYELSQALLHMGVDLNHVKFYNPGRLSESALAERGLLHGSRAGGAPPELDTSAELHHALNQDAVVQDGKPLARGTLPKNEAFLKSPGWKALPRDAFEEIHSSLQPSGLAGRLVGKTQGLTAGAILGLSPSFVIMNSLAHAVLSTFGTRGRILTDLVKYPMWWHNLPDNLRDVVRSHAGGRGEFRLERLGSTAPNQLAASWRDLKSNGIMRVASSLNPVRALFRAEDVQSNFFRHMVYYSATKRMALQNMAHDLGPAAGAAARLQHAFTVGPKDQMAAVLANMHDAEELGRYTVNMMGDYARFTARERKWLNNRAVLFYSFLRHATRTLLYVLPFKHPIATALTGELAKLHDDEVKQMLGGANLPYAYSRLFFHGKDGKLSSIDFQRSSPVGSAVTDVPAQGVRGLSGLIAPEIQPVLDMIYGQTAGGQTVPNNAFSLLGNYLSLSYPYRLAKDLRFGTAQQQPDSIPFLHERPETRKTASGQEYLQAKAQANGPIQQKILAGALGLYPKPDNTGVVAAHRLAKTSGGSSAGGWGGGSSSSGGWGGGTSSSGGWG